MDDKNVSDVTSPGQAQVKRPKRGRKPKSANDWSVIDGGFSGIHRPDPPEDLTEAQAAIWQKIVSSEKPDFFGNQACRDMLKDLVCHRDSINSLTATINQFRTEWLRSADGARMYDRYLKMRSDETRVFSLLATRLRLTNQSRYTPGAAATAGRSVAQVRPWEESD